MASGIIHPMYQGSWPCWMHFFPQGSVNITQREVMEGLQVHPRWKVEQVIIVGSLEILHHIWSLKVGSSEGHAVPECLQMVIYGFQSGP